MPRPSQGFRKNSTSIPMLDVFRHHLCNLSSILGTRFQIFGKTALGDDHQVRVDIACGLDRSARFEGRSESKGRPTCKNLAKHGTESEHVGARTKRMGVATSLFR